MEMNTLGGYFTVSVAPTSNTEHRENKSSRQYRRGASCRMIKPKSCRALVTSSASPAIYLFGSQDLAIVVSPL